MRILIAEDERITRATLVRYLEAGGFDIVVTDWDMPQPMQLMDT